MNHTVEVIWYKHPYGNWSENVTDKIPQLNHDEAEFLRELYSNTALVKAVNVTEEP